jgi:hypothetical protein
MIFTPEKNELLIHFDTVLNKNGVSWEIFIHNCFASCASNIKVIEEKKLF